MKQNIVIYNGIQYHISIKIFAPNSKKEYDDITKNEFDVLMYDNVVKLEYENDISNPLLIGELIYSDNSNSVLNKFLSISNRYINISIKKLKNIDTLSINSIMDEDTDSILNHTFLVEDIIKVDQKADIITYSLKLVSSHWWNFNANLVYSTHDIANYKESPIEILKKLYKDAGLVFDTNNITTNTKISFISDTDESLQTAQQYLLKRTYDLNTLDTPGLIKVVYDYISNRYILWSLKDHSGDSYASTYYPNITQAEIMRNTIAISLYNSYQDTLDNQDPTTFEIINFKPSTSLYQKMFDYKYWTYDYITNVFNKPKEIKNQNIVESIPYIKKDPIRFDKKFFNLSNMISKKEYKGPNNFSTQSSQWDPKHWSYDDIDDLFLTNCIISVNTAGNMLRKPGDNTFLQVDKTDLSSITHLKGDWINTRVVHTFGQNSYRNTILLSRVNIAKEDTNETFFQKL